MCEILSISPKLVSVYHIVTNGIQHNIYVATNNFGLGFAYPNLSNSIVTLIHVVTHIIQSMHV